MMLNCYIIVYYHPQGGIRYYADKSKEYRTWTNNLDKCKHIYDPMLAQMIVNNVRNNGIHSVNARVVRMINNKIVVNKNRRNKYGNRR